MENLTLTELLPPLINFAVVLGILVHFGRKPTIDFFQARSVQLSKAASEASQAAKKANQEYEILKNSLGGLEREYAQKRAEMEQGFAKARAEELARSEREAERIRNDAAQLLAGERKRRIRSIQSDILSSAMARVRGYVTQLPETEVGKISDASISGLAAHSPARGKS